MKKMYKPDNFLKTHDNWLVTTYMEKICSLNNKAVDELEEHFELHSELLVKVKNLEKQVKELEEDNVDIENENTKLEKKVKKLQSELNSLQNDFDITLDKVAELEELLKNK